jgi:predicted nucleic acid-binding protein
VIHLDTSILIDALTGPRSSLPAMRRAVAEGERLVVSSLVLYEWLRGPRQPDELRAQEHVCPSEGAVVMDHTVATLAARLYRSISRPRGREIDLLIAAAAITHEAALWTLNPADFADMPGLRLYRTPSS